MKKGKPRLNTRAEKGNGMKDRYRQIQDGEPVKVRAGEVYGTACCDCLLVHYVRIVRRGQFFLVSKWRKNGATANLRRNRDWKWKKTGWIMERQTPDGRWIEFNGLLYQTKDRALFAKKMVEGPGWPKYKYRVVPERLARAEETRARGGKR